MTKTKRKKAPRVEFAVPPPERAQHDDLEVKAHDPQNPGSRRVQVRTPNRLSKYFALGSISEDQMLAGEELATLWDRAGIAQRVTANLLSSGGGSYRNLTDGQVAARQRLVRALGGDREPFANLLVDCCCYDKPVPTRRLRPALDLLVKHFGI